MKIRRVSDLNDLLEQGIEVAGYPYQFQVLRIQNSITTISKPRSTNFPVYRALGIPFPHLENRAKDDPDAMEAQQELAKIQNEQGLLSSSRTKLKVYDESLIEIS